MARIYFALSYDAILIVLSISGIFSTSFTISNNCSYIVWPTGVFIAGSETAQFPFSGLAFQSGVSMTFSLPSQWSGRIWGRTHCKEEFTGYFSCVTGDCGSGTKECRNNATATTLAEFTLKGPGGLDFYDVSLVDGYNLPMLISPQGGSGVNCSPTGCLVDLNGSCPSELKLSNTDGNESVACKSVCQTFGEPQYCCIGAYSTPDTCKPTSYSLFFKNACPLAYSYAYDDETSTFICANASYRITFCPSTTTNARAVELPPVDGAMVFLGGHQASRGSSRVVVQGPVIFYALAILASSWRL